MPQGPNHIQQEPEFRPCFTGRRTVIPERRGCFSSFKKLFLVLFVSIALIGMITFGFTNAFNSSRLDESRAQNSFYELVHPFVREWMPTWIVSVLFAFAIGISIRIARMVGRPRKTGGAHEESDSSERSVDA